MIKHNILYKVESNFGLGNLGCLLNLVYSINIVYKFDIKVIISYLNFSSMVIIYIHAYVYILFVISI